MRLICTHRLSHRNSARRNINENYLIALGFKVRLIINYYFEYFGRFSAKS